MNLTESCQRSQTDRRWAWVLQLIVAVAFLMESIDGSMISTALPAIAADLHVSPIQLKSAFTAYFLAMAVFIPISGWCADRYGARNTLCLSIAIFTMSSVACASATSAPVFVAARGMQGIGGAMMFPVGRLILIRSMPKAEFVRVFANVTIPATIGAIGGPMVGGFFATYLRWTWLFWINLPIGIAIATLGAIFIRNTPADSARFDFLGFVLSGVALSSLGYGLTSIGLASLPVTVAVALFAAGALATVCYLRHVANQAAPILDLKLLAIDTYRTGILSGFVIRAAGAGAFSFLLPLLLQIGFGLTPMRSGLLTFSSAAGFFATKFFASHVLKRFGFRRVLFVNALVGGIVIGWLALLLPSTPGGVVAAMLFCGGLSRCLQYMALDTLSYADMPQAAVSRASTIASVSKQMAAAVGVASAALLLQAVTDLRGAGIADVLNFRWAFILIALGAAATALVIRRLARDAGSEVSGHKATG